MLLNVRSFIVAAGLIVSILVVACDSGEQIPTATEQATVAIVATESPAPTVAPAPTDVSPTATLPEAQLPPSYARYRWGNVTVVVPEGIVAVVRTTESADILPPNGGLVITLRHGDSAARIDAQTGTLIDETEFVDDQIEAAVGTIRTGEPLGEPAPWPLADIEEGARFSRTGRATYRVPDPDAGIDPFFLCAGAPVGTPGDGCAVGITSGRSTLGVDTSGMFRTHDNVQPEDQEAFDRWLAAVVFDSPSPQP